MDLAKVISFTICLALSAGSFVISYFQFMEKGFLFNNAYLWGSQEQRRRMDQDKESKKPHYRQSGVVFLFLGMTFLIMAVYTVTSWPWMLILSNLIIVVTMVYAVVSSIKK